MVSFTYTIIDSQGLKSTATVNITVNSVNDTPTINNSVSNQVIKVSELLSYELPNNLFSDSDGDNLTITANLANGNPLPSWLSFDGNKFSGTPTNFNIGILQVVLTATDIHGAFVAQNFDITVEYLNQIIEGSEGDDNIKGGDDSDTINAGVGNDYLEGGNGDDVYLYSLGDGNDTISDYGGIDIIQFGENITIDNISFARTGKHLIVNIIHGSQLNQLTISSYFEAEYNKVEFLLFNDGSTFDLADATYPVENLTINGNTNDNILNGGAGNDVINGNQDDDIIYGNGGNDILRGGQGNDIIYGGDGDDIIFGSSGNNYINGGQGADILTGRSGNNIFAFDNISDSTINYADLITDFKQGKDKIDFSNLNFTDILPEMLNDSYSIDETTLTYRFEGSQTIIEDQEQLFQVRLEGNINLNAGDFDFG